MRKFVPKRRIDAPWSISQDESPFQDTLLRDLILSEEDLQLPPYPWQYVHNEILNPICGVYYKNYISLFATSYTPILPGSVTATIYVKSSPIQIFIGDISGNVKFNLIGNPTIVAESGSINFLTGQIQIIWRGGKPEKCHLVMSYEYECSSSVEQTQKYVKPRGFV